MFGFFGVSGSVALWLCGHLGTKKCISACRGRGEHIYIYTHEYIHATYCVNVYV